MMRADPLEGVPPPLWRRVALARHRLLMLDYDGTLAPFRVTRHDAAPLPASMERLRDLARQPRDTLAILSGRPLAELAPLVDPLPVVLVGEHGWERRPPGGPVEQFPLESGVRERLDEAEAVARAAGLAELLERKRAAIVLHTRALPGPAAREREARCLASWDRLALRGLLRLERIDGGVELRASARDKGTVVRALWSECPPGTLAVFVGDDTTDEDAFEAVHGEGFGVRVGRSSHASAAIAWLPSPDAVPVFLDEWRRAGGGGDPDA